jgi:hypothetical protein
VFVAARDKRRRTFYHLAPSRRASPAGRASGTAMNDETIRVRATASGQMLDVVVFDKRVELIRVVLGQGVHSVRCDLVPTRNGTAYVGNAMGREIVYERSRDDVKADLARAAGIRNFRR